MITMEAIKIMLIADLVALVLALCAIFALLAMFIATKKKLIKLQNEVTKMVGEEEQCLKQHKDGFDWHLEDCK